MSVHDRAAIRATPRYDLTVCRYSRGCAQYHEYEALSATRLEAEKRRAIESWPYPSLVDEFGSYALSFEVTRV